MILCPIYYVYPTGLLKPTFVSASHDYWVYTYCWTYSMPVSVIVPLWKAEATGESYPFGHGRWQSYYVEFWDITENLLNNVPECFYHIVPIVLCSIYYVCLPVTPTQHKVICPCLSTGQLILDLHPTWFSQDLLMSHSTPLAGRSHSNKHQAKGVWKSIPQRSMWVKNTTFTPCQPSKVPVHGYQLDIYYWTCTLPGSARNCMKSTPSLQWTLSVGEHSFIWVWVFGCWTEPHPEYVLVGICQCSCLQMDQSILCIASIMVLVWFCDSFLIILKLPTLLGWPVMFISRKRGFKVFFKPFLQRFLWILLYTHPTTLCHT